MSFQPGVLVAHYRIGSMIGAGGMGEVYRATDTRIGRDVALKVLPADLGADPERLRRFEREAQSGSFDVAGNLTIRGVTRRIVAPVRFLGVTDAAGRGQLISFETQFVVDRRDFGVLGTRWSGGKAILGDEVNVRLTVAARRAN